MSQSNTQDQSSPLPQCNQLESGLPAKVDTRFAPSIAEVDIKALGELAKCALKKSDIPSVTLHAANRCNTFYTLTFKDGFEVIAKSPLLKYYHKPQMETEIPTMIFARQFYNIPIPRIYAWSVELGDASPVGALFILMERLPGSAIRSDKFWVRMDDETRMKVLRSVPAIHHELTKPLPPTLRRLGNIKMRNFLSTCLYWEFESVPVEEFEVAPYIEPQHERGNYRRNDTPRTLPTRTFDNIAEYWIEASELEFIEAKRRFSRSLTPEEPYVLPSAFEGEPGDTATDLAGAYRDLMAILGHYQRTQNFEHVNFRPCLWHHDFRLVNILFDPETFRVTGLLDWEDASIVPRILSARYPRDLECGGVPDDPTGPGWRYFTRDFTVRFQSEYDLDFFIDSTWYRFLYSGLLAEMDVTFGAKFWRESEMALKLKEIVDGGFPGWLQRKEWLEKTAAKIVVDCTDAT